jgi:hypothetical protein
VFPAGEFRPIVIRGGDCGRVHLGPPGRPLEAVGQRPPGEARPTGSLGCHDPLRLLQNRGQEPQCKRLDHRQIPDRDAEEARQSTPNWLVVVFPIVGIT